MKNAMDYGHIGTLNEMHTLLTSCSEWADEFAEEAK